VFLLSFVEIGERCHKNNGVQPFTGAPGPKPTKILQAHSFLLSWTNPSATFCPNRSSFERDIHKNVLKHHYNIGSRALHSLWLTTDHWQSSTKECPLASHATFKTSYYLTANLLSSVRHDPVLLHHSITQTTKPVWLSTNNS